MGHISMSSRPVGGWGGEPKLSFVVEAEFADEMESSVSTGRGLWGDDGGHG